MGEAIGFYFRQMNKEEVTAIRAELNRIAKELGYTAKTGPTMGQGNAAALLVAIAKGEAFVLDEDALTALANLIKQYPKEPVVNLLGMI